MLKISRNVAFFSLIALTSLSFTTPSEARQNHQTQVVSVDLVKNFLDRDLKVVEIYNDPRESVSDFVIRLANPGQYSGCAIMVDGSYETEFKNEGAKIIGTEMELELLGKPRYSNHDCVAKENISFLDIPMNRDQLIQDGVNAITIETNYGNYGTYELIVSKEKIDIIVPYAPQRPGENQAISPNKQALNKDYTLRFWFFPKNAVLLSTPHAKLGVDVREHLHDFAKKRGLVPLEEVFAEYKSPYHANHYAIFTDPNGLVTNQLGNKDSTVMGTINVTRKAFDINGPKEQVKTIEVRASYPNIAKDYK